jgi:hypothetical protein
VFAELERNPGFARRVIAALSAKLHASVRELDMYALGSGGRRFAAWLLRSVPPQERGAAAVTLPAAKRAIASQLNFSPEHLRAWSEQPSESPAQPITSTRAS